MHYNLNTKYYFINNFDTNNIDQQDKQTIIFIEIIVQKNRSLEILNLKIIVKKKVKILFI